MNFPHQQQLGGGEGRGAQLLQTLGPSDDANALIAFHPSSWATKQ